MKKKFIILLIIFGLIIYLNSLFNGFVWDDEETIVNNQTIRSIKNIPSFFTNSVDKNSAYYRPVTLTILTVVYSIFGERPFFFRLLQVLIHITSGVIIFLIFSKLFNKNYLLAFFLSLIFLVHPVNSEAILFMSAMQETLFFLVGAIALLIIINNQNLSLKKFVAVEGLLFVGLFIKETAVIFFALIFFYLLLFNKKLVSKHLVIGAGFFWLYFFLRILAGNLYVQGQGLFPIMRVVWWIRFLTIPKIILFYIEKFFIPWRLVIAQHWVVSTPTLTNFYFPLIVDVVFFTAIIIYCLKTKNKLFIFFALWFVIGLFPHLQLIPLNMTVAERWLYFPIGGLLGMMGVFINKLKTGKNIQIILCFIAVCLLSTRTIIRSFDWRNELSLFSHDIKLTAHTFDLENNFGVALFRSGKINEAEIHFNKSIELAQDWWVNWNNLGAVYEKKGNFLKSENCYLHALKNGDYYLAYENYAGILIRQKKYLEAKQFVWEKALPKFPYNQKLNSIYNFLLTNPK